MDKEDFLNWLRSNRAIKEYSANRYANAIVSISSDLKAYGINETDLFEISDIGYVDKILKHPEFLSKDSKGNRMYSSALKHFRKYVEYRGVLNTNIASKVERKNDETDITYTSELAYEEGKELLRLHKIRERDPKLIKDAKKRFKKNHGKLFCEACGINFEEVYGERGKDFIEGHHKNPISEMKEGEMTKVEDIGMLCSNCHRMIHRMPFISIEELRLSLRKK